MESFQSGGSRDGEAELIALGEAVPGLAFVVDAHGSPIHANDRFREWAGQAGAMPIGDEWTCIVHMQDRAQVAARWAAAKAQGRAFELQCRLAVAQGQDQWIKLRAVPVQHGECNSARWALCAIEIPLPTSALDSARHEREPTVRHSEHSEREDSVLRSIASTPAAIAVFDCQMRYLALSRKHLGDFGLPADALPIGHSHYDVFPGISQSWRDVHARVLQGDEIQATADVFHHPDGRTDRVRWAMRPWHTGSGQIGGAVLYSEIISAQVEAQRLHHVTLEREQSLREVQLRYAQAQLEQILDDTPDPIWTKDLQGRWGLVNAAAAAVVGHPRQTLAGHRQRDTGPAAEADAEDWSVLTTGMRVQGEVELFDASRGESRIFLRTKVPLRAPDGRVTGLVGIARDITERKVAEGQLRRSRDAFYALLQNNPFGIVVADAEFRIRQVSLGAQHVFAGIEPLIGRDYGEVQRILWPEPLATELAERLLHTLRSGEPYVGPRTVQRRQDTGLVESYDWRIERVMLPEGRWGLVCYFYDLSERMAREAALAEAVQARQTLLDTVNHRVNSNLQIINSLLSLQARHATTAEEQRASARAQVRINTVTWLHAQLHPASPDVSPDYCDHVATLAKCIFSSLGASRQIRLDLSCNRGLVLGVDLAMPLSLALAELLANAVKHAFAQGRGGTIALAIRREGGALSVLVADNGVGLPTGFDPSASTGLGMKIVQALVHQQLDGRLEFVDSSHGAAFHITIPMD